MTGIITSLPPLIEQPPGNASSNPAGLPGVTYTAAVPTLPQTWSGLQTFLPGSVQFAGSTSGNTFLNASAIASGTVALPAITGVDTLLANANVATITNKSIDGLTNTFSNIPTSAIIPSGGGSFTSGSIPFADSLGALTQDPAISWDNTLKKFNLNLSGTALAAAETNTGFQMDGADGFATTIFMDSHGATAAIDFRQQGGTKASPTASAVGATMGQLNFQGWDGTAYGKAARVRAVGDSSGATWTLTDHGMRLGFFTTAPGTLLLTEKVTIFGSGGMTIGAALVNQGAGSLNLAALYSNNTLIVDSSGNVTGTAITASGNLSLGAANSFAFTGRSVVQSGSDGNLTLLNSAGTGFTSLKLGGATASFPEIKRNATAINFRLADDSADAPITAGAATFSGSLTYGGVTLSNSVTGTGSMVLATSPSLVTPSLGAATATSINKVAITAPATSATLTIPDGVTLTGPAASGTAMTLGNIETVTGIKTFGSAGAVGRLKVAGTTSGSTVLDATAIASGTLTLPAATDTLVGKATTDIFTNKTFDTAGAGNSFSINSVAVTANTGTGAVVRAATPTLTGTPVLAAPSATTLIVGSSTTLVSPAITAITANSTTLPAPAAGTILHVAGANSSTAGIVLDAFNSSPNFTFRTALTSAGSPSAVTSGSVMMTFGGIGYGATGYSSSARMQITGKATENWSDTAQGTSLQFNTTPNTTITPALALLIQNSGGCSIGLSTDPGIGALLTTKSIKSQGATDGIGYATGAGGTITQGTNRTTGVTLNTVSGAITLFSQVNTAISQATAQSFTVTNSAVAATDVPHVVQKSGTDKYEIFVTNVASGSFQITNYAVAGTTNEAPVFNFVIIKGVAT